MAILDYQTELKEAEEQYIAQQALIKSNTEKLIADMEESFVFFIEREFVTGKACVYLNNPLNFAINEVSGFKCVAFRIVSAYSVFPNGYFIKYCLDNNLDFNVIESHFENLCEIKYKLTNATIRKKTEEVEKEPIIETQELGRTNSLVLILCCVFIAIGFALGGLLCS